LFSLFILPLKQTHQKNLNKSNPNELNPRQKIPLPFHSIIPSLSKSKISTTLSLLLSYTLLKPILKNIPSNQKHAFHNAHLKDLNNLIKLILFNYKKNIFLTIFLTFYLSFLNFLKKNFQKKLIFITFFIKNN
jgi:hypothetical protein